MVLRNGLKRGVRWRSGVPVQLHVDATGPLDNDIPPDRIVKRIDQYVCASRTSSAGRLIQVRNQIAGPLHTERIGNRRFETKYG